MNLALVVRNAFSVINEVRRAKVTFHIAWGVFARVFVDFHHLGEILKMGGQRFGGAGGLCLSILRVHSFAR